ncbi:hypothetical protein AB0I61_17455 [Polymorphospora rubra]|uniref:hypothetical protein n=1 Tax=Polymorphospora rubra TaxID=338584 RepID=UPI0033CECD65
MTAVIRPTWTPQTATPVQLRLLEKARRAWREAEEAETAAWAAIQALREAGVPDLSIPEQIEGVSRRTMHRRLGPRSPQEQTDA